MSKPTAWDKVITILNEEMAEVERDRGIDSAAYRALERVLIKAQLKRAAGTEVQR